jgi:hypothetical protein
MIAVAMPTASVFLTFKFGACLVSRGDQSHRSIARFIFRSRLSIENIEIIDADCTVRNFTKSICEVHNENGSKQDTRGAFHGTQNTLLQLILLATNSDHLSCQLALIVIRDY